MEHQETQKIEALKRVYADTILNTTREAAARIMVSERKASCFQQTLFSAKEEALGVLLRLKQVMDAKIADVELTFLKQRLKIEELEAQLHEAEDVVIDLRAQLDEVQNELEDMRKAQEKISYEKTATSSAVSHENSCHAKVLKASEAFSFPLHDAGSGFKDSSFDEQKTGAKSCFSSKIATAPIESLGKFPVENSCVGNPSIASKLMTTNEPEPDRNRCTNEPEPELDRDGCTQTIQAIEQNLLSGTLSLPVQKDNQDLIINLSSTIKADETAEMSGDGPSPRQQNLRLTKKKPTGLIDSFGQDKSSDKGLDVKFTPRISSRKSTSKYKKPVVSPSENQVIQTCAASIPSKAYSCPGNSRAESGENLSRKTDKEVHKNLESHMHPVSSSNETNTKPLPQSIHDLGYKTETTKSENIQNDAASDNVSGDMPDLSRQVDDVAGSSGVPNFWHNYGAHDLTTDSASKEIKTCNTNETTTQASNDRFLKYTFQRKRKKGTLSYPDETDSREQKTVKKRAGENQIGALEPSSLIIGSSRDSRRLVQVARQLISLSEKRW